MPSGCALIVALVSEPFNGEGSEEDLTEVAVLESLLQGLHNGVNTGISFCQEKNTEIDTSNDKLPGASIVGAAFATVGLWIGFIFIGGIISSIGFLCSLFNIKIAQDMIIKRISKAFSYFYLVVLALLFFAFVFFVISVF